MEIHTVHSASHLMFRKNSFWDLSYLLFTLIESVDALGLPFENGLEIFNKYVMQMSRLLRLRKFFSSLSFCPLLGS
jgi:hypothetical protein